MAALTKVWLSRFVETKNEPLDCNLTGEEARERGLELGAALKQVEDLTIQHAAELGKLKHEQRGPMAEATAAVDRLKRAVNDRVETRQVPTMWRHDLHRRVIERVRLDTMDVIESQWMDDKMYDLISQPDLPLGAPASTPTQPPADGVVATAPKADPVGAAAEMMGVERPTTVVGAAALMTAAAIAAAGGDVVAAAQAAVDAPNNVVAAAPAAPTTAPSPNGAAAKDDFGAALDAAAPPADTETKTLS